MTQHSSFQVPELASRSALPDVTAPDGSEIRFLIDQRHQASAASMVEVTLPAGQVSRPVWHQNVEEVWYVLQGQGEVWRCPPNGDPALYAAVAVKPGDSLVIPPRWRFQFSASDSGPGLQSTTSISSGAGCSTCRERRSLRSFIRAALTTMR